MATRIIKAQKICCTVFKFAGKNYDLQETLDIPSNNSRGYLAKSLNNARAAHQEPVSPAINSFLYPTKVLFYYTSITQL